MMMGMADKRNGEDVESIAEDIGLQLGKDSAHWYLVGAGRQGTVDSA